MKDPCSRESVPSVQLRSLIALSSQRQKAKTTLKTRVAKVFPDKALDRVLAFVSLKKRDKEGILQRGRSTTTGIEPFFFSDDERR